MINGKSLIQVWEDTYYQHTGETLYYKVKINGDDFKRGIAVSLPDGTLPRVYVNRIAVEWFNGADYLPQKEWLTTDGDACCDLTLVACNSGFTEQATVGTIRIVDGWYGSVSTLLSEPVNGHADMRMGLPITLYSESGETIELLGCGDSDIEPEPEPEPDTAATKGRYVWISFEYTFYSFGGGTYAAENGYRNALYQFDELSKSFKNEAFGVVDENRTIAPTEYKGPRHSTIMYDNLGVYHYYSECYYTFSTPVSVDQAIVNDYFKDVLRKSTPGAPESRVIYAASSYKKMF